MREIRSAAELYATAIAMEREAGERYAGLAERMRFLGKEALAEVFERLAGFEAEHLQALLARTDGMSLPAVTPPAEEPAAPILSPREALATAMRAEIRAQVFFERIMTRADDPALRSLAREMAAEEAEHAELLQGLLEVDLHQDRPEPAF